MHGPLEFLFTIDEETGLTGANNLAPGLLAEPTLLNLDSEEEGALYVGCSGGRDTHGHLDAGARARRRQEWSALAIQVTGLKGGHSGLEIDKGRGNAIKILQPRALAPGRAGRAPVADRRRQQAQRDPARGRRASSSCRRRRSRTANGDRRAGCTATAKAELATVEPDLHVTAERLEGGAAAGPEEVAARRSCCQTIAALPHGVIKMSADIPGLVETSTNVAIVTTGKKEIVIQTSQRSSVASEIVEIADSRAGGLRAGRRDGERLGRLSGLEAEPGLADPEARQGHLPALYGKEPAVKAVHAGLECGIIGEKYPGMDMVSFGPTLEGVHSPDEKIYIDTVEQVLELSCWRS